MDQGQLRAIILQAEMLEASIPIQQQPAIEPKRELGLAQTAMRKTLVRLQQRSVAKPYLRRIKRQAEPPRVVTALITPEQQQVSHEITHLA